VNSGWDLLAVFADFSPGFFGISSRIFVGGGFKIFEIQVLSPGLRQGREFVGIA
jgi:hypothetical protein